MSDSAADADQPVSSVAGLREMLAATLRDGTDAGLAPLVRVVGACVELLPVDGASVSVMSGTDDRETLYASDDVVARIEDLQFSLGEGPCYEAFMTGRPVLVPDLATAAGLAWPIFAEEIASEPVGAIFAFPLAVGAARVGAIDMYRTSPGSLRPAELTLALQVADLANTALLGAGTHSALPEGWLSDVPSRRAGVHQATGILIAAKHIDAGQALALLRGYAFAAERLVDDVAADLVAGQLGPDDIGT